MNQYIAANADRADLNKLFVAWLGLAGVMLWARAKMLDCAALPQHYFPVAAYQDLALAGVVAWITLRLATTIARPALRRAAIAGAMSLCLALAIYTVFSEMVFRYLRMPFSYRLWVFSDGLRGVQASLVEEITAGRIAKVVAAPILLVLLARTLSNLAPRFVSRLRHGFCHWVTILVLAIYWTIGQGWASAFATRPFVVSSPAYVLITSLFQRTKLPVFAARFPSAYLSDFVPDQSTVQRTASASDAQLALSGSTPIRNVVMVVMESVGTRWVQLDGARYADTPHLAHLAEHGLNFTRIYAPMPETSAAMPALFCSLYPPHRWRSIPKQSPAIAVPGLASVLAAHGYSVAFMHPGQLAYDRQGMFLREHGFEEIIDESTDWDSPRDQTMAARSAGWISSHRLEPFFLVLWTQDTHHPYVTNGQTHYADEPSLNRYLNAIASTDQMVGELADELRALGVAENTLLVVTGDHGEAFGEHGQLHHDTTVYDEEVRVPLLIANQRLFPDAIVSDRLGEQVDIAPTLLRMLGFDAPSRWQGRDLRGPGPRPRGYLFSDANYFSFGLVERELKYIYNGYNGSDELYDLAADPTETINLIGNSHYADFVARTREHLAAWEAFQNSYLDRLGQMDTAAQQSESAGSRKERPNYNWKLATSGCEREKF